MVCDTVMLTVEYGGPTSVICGDVTTPCLSLNSDGPPEKMMSNLSVIGSIQSAWKW